MKILHVADLHLDSPFSSCGQKKSVEKRRAQEAAFGTMMEYIKTERIPLVLIAGDLFDFGFVTKKTADALKRALASIPETKFVISPGNHDAMKKGSVYDSDGFSDNVFIFRDSTLSRFSFDELGVDVYGYAFTEEKLETSPLAARRAEETGRIPLLCMHADIYSPISRYAPVSREDIAGFGARYAALGHVHKGEIFERAGGCLFAYPGCLIGRSFDETGRKGALLVELSEGGKSSVSPVFFSDERYEIENIDITGKDSDAEAIEEIKKVIAEKGYGKETSLCAVLSGEVHTSYIPVTETIEAAELGLGSLEVKDETLPIYDAAALDADMTLRGEVWRTLKERLGTGSPEEREVAKKALAYAFASLDGRAIND